MWKRDWTQNHPPTASPSAGWVLTRRLEQRPGSRELETLLGGRSRGTAGPHPHSYAPVSISQLAASCEKHGVCQNAAEAVGSSRLSRTCSPPHIVGPSRPSLHLVLNPVKCEQYSYCPDKEMVPQLISGGPAAAGWLSATGQ